MSTSRREFLGLFAKAAKLGAFLAVAPQLVLPDLTNSGEPTKEPVLPEFKDMRPKPIVIGVDPARSEDYAGFYIIDTDTGKHYVIPISNFQLTLNQDVREMTPFGGQKIFVKDGPAHGELDIEAPFMSWAGLSMAEGFDSFMGVPLHRHRLRAVLNLRGFPASFDKHRYEMDVWLTEWTLEHSFDSVSTLNLRFITGNINRKEQT